MRKEMTHGFTLALANACLALLSAGAWAQAGNDGAPQGLTIDLGLTPAYALTTTIHAPEPIDQMALDVESIGEREQPGEAPSNAEQPAAKVDRAAYRIGPEDVLEISVWKEEGLKKEVLVRPDGGISFPLAGEITAVGKTAEAIAAEIESRLKKTINDPVVSVSVLKIAANRIYVIGRVAKPGEFVSGRYVDVLQALAMAGGLTPYASENSIRILRKHDGVEETFEFRYSDVRRGRNLEQNITLQGGDVVVVP